MTRQQAVPRSGWQKQESWSKEYHPDLSKAHQRQVLRAYGSAIGKAHVLREIAHLKLGPSGTLRRGLP
jgi:hypothetical protein